MDVKPIEVCCAPLLDTALSQAEAEDLAAAFKVLANPARLRLLSMIASTDESCPVRWSSLSAGPSRR